MSAVAIENLAAHAGQTFGAPLRILRGGNGDGSKRPPVNGATMRNWPASGSRE